MPAESKGICPVSENPISIDYLPIESGINSDWIANITQVFAATEETVPLSVLKEYTLPTLEEKE